MSKEMVKNKEHTMDVMLMEDAIADAGAGFENVGVENKAIPYLSLAQALSDKVKRGPDKVEGLEEGDFLNTATMEIFKAGSFRVVPCAFQMVWIEKDSLGKDARIIAIHDNKPAGLTSDDKGKLKNGAGNYVVPTARHFVLVIRADGSYSPALVSLSNSQIRPSKNWLSLMDNRPKIKTPGGMKPPAMFASSYAVESVPTKNAEGSWMVWKFSDPKFLESSEVYMSARAFYEEIKKGLVRVAEPIDEGAEHAASETKHF